MQRIKHLFFIFSLILVFASPVWSVDFNCSGGTWIWKLSSSTEANTCMCIHDLGYCANGLMCGPRYSANSCTEISGGIRRDWTYYQSCCSRDVSLTLCCNVYSYNGGSDIVPDPPCRNDGTNNRISWRYYSEYEWSCPCTGSETKTCYDGPAGTEGVGICRAGAQPCSNGGFGSCQGQVTPQTETCGDGIDNNCDGQIDEGCCIASAETCDNKDNNCNNEIDEGLCCEACCPTNTPLGSSANYASGNLFHSQSLFQIASARPGIAFTLAYNSRDNYSGPLGKGWTHTYNITLTQSQSGSLLLKQGDGKRIYFRNHGSGTTYRPDPSTGEYSIIVKNPDGTYTQTSKDGTTYSFNAQGKLTEIRDRNNNATTLSYTGNDLTTIQDSSGRIIRITATNGKITSIADPSGNTHTFTYSGDSLATVSTSNSGLGALNWLYTYNSSGRMLTKTDPNAYTTTYTYDSAGKVSGATDPEQKTKTISYDSANNTATITEKDGGIWIYKYNSALNVPLEETDPQGNKTTYQYDQNQNMLSKTEPDGSATTYAYDNYGNMTSQTDALGQTTQYTYNNYGQVTGVTASDGTTTTYEYDSNGNLTKTTDPTGAATQYQYDTKGNITKITNANGQTTTLTYDQQNNLTSITDPSGATTTFIYDNSGNMTSQTDANGNITRFEYNSLNQLIKTTGPNGNVTTFSYDANGNRTSSTDANGNVTRYEYNYKGQLIKVTNTLNNQTKYTYGGTGCPSCGASGGNNLTSITDAKNQITIYEYDSLGRLIKETNSLGNIIVYTYDSKGNLASKKDANGATITYTYDSLNRLISINYPDNTKTTFTYDAKGNILTASNQHITYYFTYDAGGRLLTVTDSNGRVVSYQYDAASNKVKLTYPDGTVVDYSYDVANRLASIINGSGRTYSYQYDNLGRRTKQTMPNGTYTTYSYDNSGRLTDLIHKTSSGSIIDSFSYTHDKVGNRLTKTETDVKFNYNYDKIYRLLQSLPTKLQGKDKEQENKAEKFSYDAVGNRLTGPESKDVYSYNQGNQLTNDRKHQYQYDRNGNLIKKTETDEDGKTEITTYSYDYENRLIKVTKQEGNETKTVSFKYDPFGRRIEKKVIETPSTLTGEGGGEGSESRTFTYVYDNEDIILEYLTKSDDGKTKTETTRYVHDPGIDEPLAIERKGEVYYYHADGLGSIVALTDKKQKVVESYTYSSFGGIKKQGDKTKNTYAFTGRIWDEDIQLFDYRNRDYDYKTGRFTTYDPSLYLRGSPEIPYLLRLSLPFPSQLHPYIYSSNNPINLTDPQGLFVILPPPNLLSQIICAYNEYLKGQSINSKNDKYKHCVVSCYMAKKCGKDITYLAGFVKEIKDFLDLNSRTSAEFADILADFNGVDCCSSSLGCEKCCECEKKYKP